MKKVLVLLLAFGVLLLGVTLLAAHEGEQRETVTAAEQAEVKQGEHDAHAGPGAEEVEIDIETVVGEVVDITCYMRRDSRDSCEKQPGPLLK
ncbi:MAG: hypothetical protein VX293_09125 [Candidatus Latescibacterota bacterium]|nr:hypothetical protein [Candidatus Latescibacterota bacterium]